MNVSREGRITKVEYEDQVVVVHLTSDDGEIWMQVETPATQERIRPGDQYTLTATKKGARP